MPLKPQQLIINRQDKQTIRHRALSTALLVTFWSGMLYLMRPVVVFIGWLFSSFLFGSAIPFLNLDVLVRTVFLEYLPLIAILSTALITWAQYNRLRFRGVRDKRRVPLAPLALEHIASATKLKLEQLEAMREARLLICYFDEDSGEIVNVTCCHDLSRADRFLPSSSIQSLPV